MEEAAADAGLDVTASFAFNAFAFLDRDDASGYSYGLRLRGSGLVASCAVSGEVYEADLREVAEWIVALCVDALPSVPFCTHECASPINR